MEEKVEDGSYVEVHSDLWETFLHSIAPLHLPDGELGGFLGLQALLFNVEDSILTNGGKQK